MLTEVSPSHVPRTTICWCIILWFQLVQIKAIQMTNFSGHNILKVNTHKVSSRKPVRNRICNATVNSHFKRQSPIQLLVADSVAGCRFSCRFENNLRLSFRYIDSDSPLTFIIEISKPLAILSVSTDWPETLKIVFL